MMDLQDIDEIELTMPPKRKGKVSQVNCFTGLVTFVFLFNSCYLLIPNVNGQILSLQPRMVQKRSDRATPALRGLLDTLLQPTRTASSSNGWKGFVFMDPLFKVPRSPSSSESLIEPQQQLPPSPLSPPQRGSPNDPLGPSYPMDSTQYETESAPIPYIIEPPMDMYQPMASNTRYSMAKNPYNDYYDDEVNGEPQIRSRPKSKPSTSTTTKKPNQTPAISIGPASGGGTAIRLGKAKITFKKGSISLGPVEDHETESKRSTNDESKSSEKRITNKRSHHHNYPDENDSDAYSLPSSSSSSRHQSSSSSANRDDRHQSNSKVNIDDRPVYTDDDYGPKYATNYKTSASGYYQSYKPYHNLDTLIDKQVNLNQGQSNHRQLDGDNFSPQPVYQGNTRNHNNIITSSVTESYSTKNDYDYEDSVVTERIRGKKSRDKRRDETVIEEDEDEDEVSPASRTGTGRISEKRRKGNKKTDQSNKKEIVDNEEDADGKSVAENADDEETIESSTEKSISIPTTIKSTRKKSSKPKNQQQSTTTTSKSTTRSNRNKAKSTSKPTTSTPREDLTSSDDKKLIKEHRHDHGDDDEEDSEKIKTNEDNEDEDNDEEMKVISKTTTTTTTQVTPTISSTESKKRKTGSRQNTNRRKSNNNSKQSSSTVNESQQSTTIKSTDGIVYIGNQGQSSKTRKGSIESVSISPGTSSSVPERGGGTIVTLKMAEDPSLGVIGGSINSKKPGTIYQIRLTSKIPTESTSVAGKVPIISKVPDESPIEVTKDEMSINRLIKMMQETLEDIRKSSSSSALPPLPSPSSPCPPTVIIEPLPLSTTTSTTTTTTTTPKPSLLISNLMPTTNKPVDPFLNLHHGNITIVPASMGNVSDIVEMLVKTSKFIPPSSSSVRQKSRLPSEILISSDNLNDKRNDDNDYSIDLDNSSIVTNNSDKPQAEESRSKGTRQDSNQPEIMIDQTANSKQLTNDNNNNNENGDDVPIIVVLLPPEDELPRDSIN